MSTASSRAAARNSRLSRRRMRPAISSRSCSRVPVKIVIDSGLDPICRLPLGISVGPDGRGAMSAGDHARRAVHGSHGLIHGRSRLSVTLAAFMEVLDTTIVNVSLPHIAGSLSVSNDEATWALTSYLVANGIVLTISGCARPRHRAQALFLDLHRHVHCLSFGVRHLRPSCRNSWCFERCKASSAAACNRASRRSFSTFSAGKARRRVLPDRDRNDRRTVLGPTLGGYITDTYAWHWIFFINLPVGVIAVFCVCILVEDPRVAHKGIAAIRLIGLSLITLGIGCLQIVLDRGEDLDWFGSRFIRIMLPFWRSESLARSAGSYRRETDC